MELLNDIKTIYQLSLAKKTGTTHAERLESFYGPQAEDYDRFREKLLPGRKQFMQQLSDSSGVWIDFGGGTGSNLEYMQDHIKNFERIFLVDLSPSLLAQAKARVAKHGWDNVEIVAGDATKFLLPKSKQADLVTFSYSLTMIPNWFLAIRNAKDNLKVGGKIGVIDFTAQGKSDPNQSLKVILGRGFWQTWFSWDRVFLSPDHLPFLQSEFKENAVTEELFSPPYLSFLPVKVPYYSFIGDKY